MTVAIRHMRRVKETTATVVFEEVPAEGATFNLFGPGGKVYVSKEYAKEAESILIKVEFQAEAPVIGGSRGER